MNDPARRDFLRTSALGTAGLALAALAPDRATAAATPAPATKAAPDTAALLHEPRPLWFDPAKLPGLSERLLRSHWENNYGGSVRTLNAVRQRLAAALADADMPPWAYDDLKREHLLRTGSVVLHELYFDNLGGDGEPDAGLRSTLAAGFGSFDSWETEFRRIGNGLGGGSGWVLLGCNLHTGQIENYWLADHAHAPAATLPLLVMDMYEHSYQMDYGAAAGRYVDAFFRNIRWDVVAARLARARAFASTAHAA